MSDIRPGYYASTRFEDRRARVIAVHAGNVLYDLVERSLTTRANLFCPVARFCERYS